MARVLAKLFGMESLDKSLAESLAKSLAETLSETFSETHAKSLGLDPMHDIRRDSLRDAFFYAGRPKDNHQCAVTVPPGNRSLKINVIFYDIN